MHCVICQNPNADSAKFCDECGELLGARCFACGAANRHRAKFCGECNAALPTTAPEGGPPRRPPLVIERSKTKGSPVVPAPAPEGRPRSVRAYTPTYLKEKILTTRSALEGERKLVTVLFADIADSSAFAERIDPERLHQLMNHILRLVAETVHRYEGTVNQYLGDGLMALFGAPVALEDHPLRAVQAALSIQETIGGYSPQFKREHGMDLRLRVGLNTGSVVVGRIGDDLRMDYTAVGNTTNIAARLQTLAEPGVILMSQETHRFVDGYVLCDPLGPIEIRGQREPVVAYRVTGRRRWRSRLEMSAAMGLTQLAGRRRELALLDDCLKRVEGGHGQIVGIVGEPGLGKSRLLYELHASINEDRANWLEGHCVAYGRTFPFGPVLELLRTEFHIEEGDNPLQIQDKLRRALHQLDPRIESALPFLESLFSVPGADDALRHLERKDRRQQTLEAIRAVVVSASQHRPQIVVCENLHWIDESSESLLSFLVGSLSSVPVMVLTTHRTGYRVPWADSPYYTQIALDGLAAPEIEEMLAALLGGRECPAELLQFIRGKSDGNPLFIEEITRALIERGLLTRDNGGMRLIARAELEWPESIQDIIQARIDRLEQPVKETVQTAAILGREFEFRLLMRVSTSPADMVAHIEALKRLEVIHEAHFFPQLEYRFKHAVIQEVIYKSLLAPRRRALHGVVGRAIEELYHDQIEEQAGVLAHHFSRSDDEDSAIKYALLAGDRAARVHANAEASTYYDQALVVARALTTSPDRQRAEIDASTKRANVSSTPEALEQDRQNLERAQALARSLLDESRLAQVLYWLGRVAYVRGAFPVATDYAEQSLGIADRLGEESLAAPPVNLMGRSCYLMGDYARAGDLLARSVDQMRELGNTTEEATAAGFAGVALAAIGEFPRALSYADHGLQLALELKNPFVKAAAYNYRAVAYCHQGAGDKAIADCEEARRVAEGAGDRFRIYLVQFYEGAAYLMIGNPKRGRELLEDSITLAKQLGTTTLLAWGQGLLARCLLALGDYQAVPALCEAAIQLAEDRRDRLASALAHRTLAEALVVVAPLEIEKAERAILDAIRIQKEVGAEPELARSYATYARLLQSWQRPGEAVRFLEGARDAFRRMGMTRNLARAEQAATGLSTGGEPRGESSHHGQ
jgi:predicted ATPase/class 3 adenylate cyclase